MAAKQTGGKSKMDDLYREVTEGIIADLEAGTPPWVKPWSADGAGMDPMMPYNAYSGHQYSGVNVLTLWATAARQGYPTNRWIGLKQAQALGGRLRRREGFEPDPSKPWATGQRATTLVHVSKKFEEDDEGRLVLKYAKPVMVKVFNVDQFDRETLPEAKLIGHRERREPGAAVANIQPLMNRLQLAGGYHYGGPNAYYMPGPDMIACPTTFDDDHQWAATLLHEGIHATGHPRRLDRPSLKERSKQRYAFEELVAELGAAFLCAHYDITGQCQHPSYIAGWITALNNDHRMIWRAASEAQHAVQWWLSQYEAEDIPQAAE